MNGLCVRYLKYYLKVRTAEIRYLNPYKPIKLESRYLDPPANKLMDSYLLSTFYFLLSTFYFLLSTLSLVPQNILVRTSRLLESKGYQVRGLSR